MKKPSEIILEAVEKQSPPYTILETQAVKTNAQTYCLDGLHERLLKLESEKEEDSEIIEFIKFNKITIEDLEFLMELKSVYAGQSKGLYTSFRGVWTGDLYKLCNKDFKTIEKVFK